MDPILIALLIAATLYVSACIASDIRSGNTIFRIKK